MRPTVSRRHVWDALNAILPLDTTRNLIGSVTSQRLSGIAVAVKDNICTSFARTTCGSEALREFRPPYDATVVSLLLSAGAEIVGKTNCDEFGMGSLSTHSIHGPVINPHRAEERLSAGGSSGGSAAAVASGACRVALATDTGGSTRLPAAYCGVVGLKPSYGLISRWGVISFADSLDCVGIMGKAAKDVKQIFDVLSVHDPRDLTSASEDTRHTAKSMIASFSSMLESDRLDGVRVGIPQEYFPEELRPDVLTPFRSILQKLRDKGASMSSVNLPTTPYALSAYYVLASAEASSNLARFDGSRYGTRYEVPSEADRSSASTIYATIRSKTLGEEVRKRILLGTFALTASAYDNYFLQAQRVRRSIATDFAAIFRCDDPRPSTNNRASRSNVAEVDKVDLLIHPSTIQTAPVLTNSEDSGIDTYVQDLLTIPASLAGLPALNLPVFADNGCPTGISLVGQWGSDEALLRFATRLEY